MKDSLDLFAQDKLAALEQSALRRTLVATERGADGDVLRDGRRLVSFSCNDYLGLAQHPRVKQAAIAAIERYGAGAAASRLVTGDHPLLQELEPGWPSASGSRRHWYSAAAIWPISAYRARLSARAI